MKQLKLKFLKECESNIELLRSSLASASTTSPPSETLQDLFRAVHSIKGGGGFFDLDRVVWLADAMEDVCVKLSSGSLPPTASIMQALRCAETVLTDLLDAAALGIELVQGYEKSTGDELQNLTKSKPEGTLETPIQSDLICRGRSSSQLSASSWHS